MKLTGCSPLNVLRRCYLGYGTNTSSEPLGLVVAAIDVDSDLLIHRVKLNVLNSLSKTGYKLQIKLT